MNIFVGNLNFTTTSDSLQELFKPFGEISSANVIIDRETGRSRGFGFVEMPNDAQAKKAIAALDGKDCDDRQLKVNVARERENRPRRY
jgi:RNA recognition motif-containing protein